MQITEVELKHVSTNRLIDAIGQFHESLDLVPTVHHERGVGMIGENPDEEVVYALLATGWIPPKR